VNSTQLAALALTAAVVLSYSQPARKDRHVVLISIDGFSAQALADPQLAVPHLRSLAREGAAAKAMIPVNPTVTWPNHTSLITGVPPAKHTVIYNGGAVRGAEGEPVKVEPHIPRAQLVSGTTLYDAATRAGLTTAEVDWVAIEKADGITWSFPEWPVATGAVEREMIAAGLVTAEQIAGFTKNPITFRDEIWTRAGEHILEKHKPNLLLFHLLTTDSAQHTYGPQTLAARAALELADARVGRLIEATKRAGIYERTTFVVVSDHGFKTVKRLIRPNALLKEKNLDRTAWAIPEGGTAMVYVTKSAGKAATVEQLKKLFSEVEGVTNVLTRSDFGAFGYPDPATNPKMADLVLAAGTGYSFNGAPTGETVGPVSPGSTPGSHGYLNTDADMEAILIAGGAGVKSGAQLQTVSSLDVAPTIARLLGLALPEAEGKVLDAALR
jgi:predicted AlkP superfamily pyrophosphatase or phosphodiesterase